MQEGQAEIDTLSIQYFNYAQKKGNLVLRFHKDRAFA